ncbi:MAG: MBL fold metallo-hydrolase [Gemmataceae bacterium]|nr:MBL fold metallo-hydrolase [Gemmataceae bacterium]
MSLQIHTIVSMPFAENTYVVRRVGRDGASDCVVIDPGLEPDLIFQCLAENGLRPAVILNTHGHADHIAGNAALKDAFPEAPLIIGVNDEPLLTDAMANLSAPFGFEITSPPADRLVRDGDRLDFAGLTFDVLDIPGHSPGHVVYVVRDEPLVRVFGGDVLFQGSIGRTDLPGGDQRLLVGGIRAKLFPMPDETVIYPGHGPTTTIGTERRTNPFVGVDD